MIKTTIKSKFLRQEYKEHFSKLISPYREFTRVMIQDATQCHCGLFHWKGNTRPCGHKNPTP